MKKAVFQNLENRMVTGDPGQNRTGDLPLRRRLLYPTELRNHIKFARKQLCSNVSNRVIIQYLLSYYKQEKIPARIKPYRQEFFVRLIYYRS